jgi:hypothetical protein
MLPCFIPLSKGVSPISFFSEDISIKAISPLNLLQSRRMENGVEHHFIGLLEKFHRFPEDFKSIRFQVVHKVLPGIPFLKKAEFIFLLNILAKIAAPASLLHP